MPLFDGVPRVCQKMRGGRTDIEFGIGPLQFWHSLYRHADCVALNDPQLGDISYDRLEHEAAEWSVRFAELAKSHAFDGVRLLLGIEIEARSPIIAAYLGALRAAHPVILAEPGGLGLDSAIARRYRPNAVLSMQGDVCHFEERDSSEAALDPELALLLSTSGSTGDPRLVRLSGENIDSNALAIAEYLGLSQTETAVTSLPLHYSYGLSVLHSHLSVGARVVLANASVADPAFRKLTVEQHVTSLAMVPHQIDLLQAHKLEFCDFGPIRYVTQAGGRLGPSRAKELAMLSARQGWKFFVMYGQTEAGPRIAYVPPESLAANADTIGRAIPGGRIWISDPKGSDITQSGVAGELIYEGPNVMLGYADNRDDLARGRDAGFLRTGDIAERTETGFFRIVGRAKRFVKLYGLRISLDQIEARLMEAGQKAYAVGVDDRLVVMTTAQGQDAEIVDVIARAFDLPRSDVTVQIIADVPLLSNGKTDQRALDAAARRALAEQTARPVSSIAQALADATRVAEVAPSESFVSLGGDSLGYLQVQMALEEHLGFVPGGWESMPLADLERLAPGKVATGQKVRWSTVDLDVALRIVAISCVILRHLDVKWQVQGGTYLLVALMGCSLARFQRNLLGAGALGRVAWNLFYPILPIYYLILIAYSLLRGDVGLPGYLLVANFAKDFDAAILEPLWFISLYTQIALCALAAALFGPVRRAMLTQPFLLGVTATLIAVGIAFLWRQSLPDGVWQYNFKNPWPIAIGIETLPVSLPLACLGWAAASARTTWEKVLVTPLFVMCMAVFPVIQINYFIMIGAAILAVTWDMHLPLPARLVRLVRVLAASTLFVYLAHNSVLHFFKYVTPFRALLGPISSAIVVVPICFAVGILLQTVFAVVEKRVRSVSRRSGDKQISSDLSLY